MDNRMGRRRARLRGGQLQRHLGMGYGRCGVRHGYCDGLGHGLTRHGDDLRALNRFR